jgi:thiamine-monophosphate kinase
MVTLPVLNSPGAGVRLETDWRLSVDGTPPSASCPSNMQAQLLQALPNEPLVWLGESFHYYVLALLLHERELISRIRKQARLPQPARFSKGGKPPVVVGIGDDTSVLRLPRGHEILVTTDFSLEGIHFRRDWHSPTSVGHRCLARGLSDIAAMGGEPVAAFLSLALPATLSQKWVDEFIKGLLALAKRFDVRLTGGDTAQSPNGVLADIVLVGSVPKGRAIFRSGAQTGDRIYVTGPLGGSAAALALLRSGKRLNPKTLSRHFFPEPRIEVGRLLRKKRIATSMIDVSDGLSTDLSHLCEESGCGAEIWQDAIPRARVGKNSVDLEFALHGGEDYELLFTAARKARVPGRIAGVQATEIGQITRGRQIILRKPSGTKAKLEPCGWEHFRP